MGSRVHSKDTVIMVGATQLIGCDTSEYTMGADVHDTTEYGLTGHRQEGGLLTGGFTLGGVYQKHSDFAAGSPKTLLGASSVVGTSVVITDRPEGTGLGKPEKVFTAVVAEYKESRPVADYIRWTASLTISHDPAIFDGAQDGS